MQDVFRVMEPKKLFKKERVMQVFLFEKLIVLAKREVTSKKSVYSIRQFFEVKFQIYCIRSNKSDLAGKYRTR